MSQSTTKAAALLAKKKWQKMSPEQQVAHMAKMRESHTQDRSEVARRGWLTRRRNPKNNPQ